MATQRQKILIAILAAVNGAGKPAGLTVLKARKRPSAENELPITMIVAGAETASKNGKGPRFPVVDRHFQVKLDHWVKDPESQDALEPLLAWGTKAICGNQYWGKVAISTTEDRTDWDLEMLEESFGRATQTFTVRYTTKDDNQELKQ